MEPQSDMFSGNGCQHSLARVLAGQLDDISRRNLYRQLRPLESPQGVEIVHDGRGLINFSSNDYLGLATHPEVIAAGVEATRKWGAGSGASRLISGSLQIFSDLEEALGELKRTEAALVFSTGYATALGTVPALVSSGDTVVLDRLAHACLIDAARLSGASLRVFPHNDCEALNRILARERRKGAHRILVVVESVYSMDGDLAPLEAIVEAKDRHGAWLMVDEAHATGLFGNHGNGLIHASGLTERIEVQMGTLGKALGTSGGFIAGSRTLIDLLINRARTFIFSTAPAPSVAGAALEAIRLVQSSEGERRRARLRQNIAAFRDIFGLRDPEAGAFASPIVPLMLGREERAITCSAELMNLGFLIPGIRFPTVARGAARLRITANSEHSPAMINQLRLALEQVHALDAQP